MNLKLLALNTCLRIKSDIKLFIFVLILAVPSLVSAQEEEKAEGSSDCSIPKNLRVGRPDPEGSPTIVKIGFYLIDIKDIKDVSQTYTADGFFNLSWKDPRLSKKSLGKSLKGCEVKLDQIWHPSMVPLNIINPGLSLHRVTVDDNGNVRRQARYIGELSSDFDFKEFPFDKQILRFIFTAYGEDADVIKFEKDEERTGSRERFSVEGWEAEILEPEKIEEYHAPSDQYVSQIHFLISAERQKGYYLWKVLLPLFFIVMMAWAVFWIDPSAIGPQIGLSTATVFTLIAYRFSLGFTLPRISYFTRVDIFITYATILVFLALGTAIATSRIASQGNKKLAVRIEKWAKVIYLSLFAIIIGLTFLL